MAELLEQDPQQGTGPDDDALAKRMKALAAKAQSPAAADPLAARMATLSKQLDTGNVTLGDNPPPPAPAAPIRMAPVVVKPTPTRVAAETESDRVRGLYGRNPSQVTTDESGGIVSTGRPLSGRQRVVDALTEGRDTESLGQLAGAPQLKERIGNRLAMARSHGDYGTPPGEKTPRQLSGVELAAKPLTFPELMTHVALNGAASMVGLGGVSEADDQKKIEEWAMNGGQPSEVLVPATRGTPEITRADVLGIASAGGALGGAHMVGKALSPLFGGMGPSAERVATTDVGGAIAQRARAQVLRKAALDEEAAVLAQRAPGPVQSAAQVAAEQAARGKVEQVLLMDDAMQAARAPAQLTGAGQAGVKSALSDAVTGPAGSVSRTVGRALRARVPLVADVGKAAAASAGAGAVLGGADVVTSGERDPAKIAEAVATSAAQWALLGGAAHALGLEVQFRQGADRIRRGLAANPTVAAALEAERQRQASLNLVDDKTRTDQSTAPTDQGGKAVVRPGAPPAESPNVAPEAPIVPPAAPARTLRRRMAQAIDPNLIEEQRAAEEHRRSLENELRGAQRSAETDALTGLANRAALDRALPVAEKDPKTRVILFDANNFGKVNKAVGHDAGDDVLKEMAGALSQAAREQGVVGRVFRKGGDEFAILAPTEVADAVKTRAEELFGDRQMTGKDGQAFTVSVTGTHGATMKEADAGLQAAKTARKAGQAETVTAYHGTSEEFDHPRPSKSGQFGPGIYTTLDKAEAGKYATGGNRRNGKPARVIPLQVSLKKPFRVEADVAAGAPREWFKKYGFNTPSDPLNVEAQRRLIAQGYDGIIARQPEVLGANPDGTPKLGPVQTHYVAFTADQVKHPTSPAPGAPDPLEQRMAELKARVARGEQPPPASAPAEEATPASSLEQATRAADAAEWVQRFERDSKNAPRRNRFKNVIDAESMEALLAGDDAALERHLAETHGTDHQKLLTLLADQHSQLVKYGVLRRADLFATIERAIGRVHAIHGSDSSLRGTVGQNVGAGWDAAEREMRPVAPPAEARQPRGVAGTIKPDVPGLVHAASESLETPGPAVAPPRDEDVAAAEQRAAAPPKQLKKPVLKLESAPPGGWTDADKVPKTPRQLSKPGAHGVDRDPRTDEQLATEYERLDREIEQLEKRVAAEKAKGRSSVAKRYEQRLENFKVTRDGVGNAIDNRARVRNAEPPAITDVATFEAAAAKIPPTQDIDTPEREQWRNQRAAAMATAKTHEHRIDIQLGLPGAGKSSSVDPLVAEHGAALMDIDTGVKQHAAEWHGGIGGEALHAEAVDVRTRAMDLATSEGANIVFPTVGHVETLVPMVKELQADGYDVHVHLVDVPPDVAVKRMLEGFKAGDRHFVPPDAILKRGDDARRAFIALADLPGVTAHDPLDNTVPRGEAARPIADWRTRWASDAPRAEVAGSGEGPGRAGSDHGHAAPAPRERAAEQAVTEEATNGTRDLRAGVPDESGGASPSGVRAGEGGGNAPAGRGGRGDAGAGTVRERARGAPKAAPGSGGLSEPGAASHDAGVDGAGAGDGRSGRAPADRARRDAGRRNGRNYELTPQAAAELLDGGPVAKAGRNVQAIALLKAIEAEGRPATADEQRILSAYTGWGGIPQAFDPGHAKYGASKGPQLRDLLTDAEWEAARASTPTAHYTHPDVIAATHRLLNHLGFTGGHLLEPSMGAGYFLGLTPAAHRADYHWMGVELDAISGRIAKLLYPESDIRVQGFQDVQVPDGYFDAAVGNVPFGNYKVHDPRYNALKLSIHNYFFRKTLDLVRPGGVVAFVTSSFTMDGRDSAVRKELAQHADLLGAIRLPNDAQKKIANVDVVTDLIVLRKRAPGAAPPGAAWLKAEPMEMPEGTIHVNEYFAANPQHVLGRLAGDGSMNTRDGSAEMTVHSTGALAPQLEAAVRRFPVDGYAPAAPTSPASKLAKEMPVVFAPDHVRDYGYTVEAGQIMQRRAGVLVDAGVPRAHVDRVTKLIGLRDLTKRALEAQIEDRPEGEIESARKALEKAYTAFTRTHGPILKETRIETKRLNPTTGEPVVQVRTPNLAYFEDGERALVTALEHYDPESGTAEKGDILTRRVYAPRKALDRVDTPADALPIVLADAGKVDLARIAHLSGVSEADAAAALRGQVFEDPAAPGTWKHVDEYTSGDVKTKLAELAAKAKADPARWADNLTALEAAIPEDLPPSKISARLGAPWIPTTDIAQFVKDVIGADGNVLVTYTPAGNVGWKVNADWRVQNAVAATTDFGTSERNAISLIEDALNLKTPTVYDPPDSNGTRAKNADKTLAAQEKQQKLHERFERWVWEDGPRADRLARAYNDKFNRIRNVTPDGAHLTLPGAAAFIKGKPFALRPHQKNAIWRIITYGNTLLAHVVGSGKTYTMIAAGMEEKRLGLVRKPMYVVPNHMLDQFATEFKQLYPAADILLATRDDFAKDERKAFVARAATNNWDAIVMTHRSFESIPMSNEFQERFIRSQLDELEDAIREAKTARAERALVKQIEKAKLNLEAKLEGMMAEGKKDQLLSFEQIGADRVFVDEADQFKNLMFTTKLEGVSAPASQRAFDLYMKSQHLEAVNPGRGLVFATGTPIANAVAEMYTMQRYLQPKALAARGISNFDPWAATFGRTVTGMEMKPDNSGFRLKTRFASYDNVGELAQMFRAVTDVQTAEDLDLPRPKLKGGAMQIVTAPTSGPLKAYVKHLAWRGERVQHRLVEPDEDNWLKITGDGRRAALDMRLVRSDALDLPDSKLNKAVDQIHALWEGTKALKGAQLVFSDLSTPGSDPATQGGVPGFNVYDDMKRKLVAKGIPSKEVRFIHDAKTDEAKKKLFADVRAGRVRILFGSTEKMGAGTNVQDRLVALHNLDAPWRPRDIEQRHGRILRQGNQLYDAGKIPHVEIHTYITEGSFDGYIWQNLERKAGFIKQALTADAGTRSIEDVGEVQIDWATAKAIASGNPKVKEKAEVDVQVQKLERLERAHRDEQFSVRKELATLPAKIAADRAQAEKGTSDVDRITPTQGDKFAITIGGATIAKRVDAGVSLQAAVQKAYEAGLRLERGAAKDTALGTFAGLDLALVTNRAVLSGLPEVWLKLTGADTHFRELGENDSPASLVAQLEAMPAQITKQVEGAQARLASNEKRLATLKEKQEGDFPKAAELDGLRKRQAALETDLAKAAEEKPEEAAPETRVAPARRVSGPALDALKEAKRLSDDLKNRGFSVATQMKLDAAMERFSQLSGERGSAAEPFATWEQRMFREAGLTGGDSPTQAMGFADPITAAAYMLYKTPAVQASVGRAVAKLTELGADLRRVFDASGVSPQAGQASRIVRPHRAIRDREIARARAALKQTRKALDKLDPGALYDGPRWQAYRQMEEGIVPADPAMRTLWKTLRGIQDQARDAVHALGPGHLDHFIEDYMARVYVPLTGAKKARALRMYGARRPMEGPKRFKKARQHEGLEESITAALAKGVGPPTDNPLDMVLLKIYEMRQYVMAHRIRDELKEQGLSRFLRAQKLMPDGYAALEDRMFTVHAARGAEGEERIRGHYIAPVEVARVINNFMSPGLRGKVWYDAYAGLGNNLNMVQLGISAFHLGLVSFDATAQLAAVGLDQVLTGKGPGGRLAGAGKVLGAAASAATGPITVVPLGPLIATYLRGRKVWHAYFNDAQTKEMQDVIDGLLQGGGLAKMDDRYKNGHVEKMRAAFHDRRWLGTALHAPFAAIEATMFPLLEHVVPRMKLGAIDQMMPVEKAKLPANASEDDVRKAAARVVDAIDARLGQMIYSNRFWHTTTKEMMMAGIRSVGWNAGSVDVTLGAAAQLLGNVRQLGHGRRPDSWHKVEYLAAVAAMVALYGAMYTFLHTGEAPKEWKDYYYPRTGSFDKDGNPERMTPATYMKDVFSMTRHPIKTVGHKLHPLLGVIAEILSNKDFYGDMIHDEDASFPTKREQDLAYIVHDVLKPFTIRNMEELSKRGAGAREKLEGFLGNQAAPREFERTPAQNKMAEILARRGHPLRTPEQKAKAEDRRDITDAIKAGTIKRDSIRLLVRNKDLTKEQAIHAAIAARESPLLTRFKMLSAEEAQTVYDLGTPDEQALWEKQMRRKGRRLHRPGLAMTAP